ncbi:hypothetical protein [Rugamonas sp.]|uniref:hypothetical protein n=1 Tax=Rugamonas sp. TaxID=1926287 RepID=UPI0025DF2822|nr:hypothetical protein [Rugamonas sp.]
MPSPFSRSAVVHALTGGLFAAALIPAASQTSEQSTVINGAAAAPNVIVVQSTKLGQEWKRHGPAKPPPAAPATCTQPCPAPAPAPTIPAGFVVVQTTYLEQVAATAKAGIDAAKDNVAFLVTIMTTVGAFGTVLALFFGFFCIKTYKDVTHSARIIKGISRRSKTELKNVAAARQEILTIRQEMEQAVIKSRERMSELEQLSVGMHYLRFILDELKKAPLNSEEQINDAKDSIEEAIELFTLAEKHVNVRLVSFMAATLSIILMRAKKLDQAYFYGLRAIKDNPKNWPDRPFNLACICVAKYKATGKDSDKVEALKLLKQCFEVYKTPVDEALSDQDLEPIWDDLAQLKNEYEANKKGPVED